MTQPQLNGLATERNRRFHWETILPRRKDLIQTLILFPFGLPVAHFLGTNWNFAIALIAKGHQSAIGIIAIAVSPLLPSLFFACLFHWGTLVRAQRWGTWYPNSRDLLKGFYATMTSVISCGLVDLVAQSLGVCNNPAWNPIAQSVLCNLDDYGFESKSWIGVWLIVAAYCYRLQEGLDRIYQRIVVKTK
jgi:hypothetical protein